MFEIEKIGCQNWQNAGLTKILHRTPNDKLGTLQYYTRTRYTVYYQNNNDTVLLIHTSATVGNRGPISREVVVYEAGIRGERGCNTWAVAHIARKVRARSERSGRRLAHSVRQAWRERWVAVAGIHCTMKDPGKWRCILLCWPILYWRLFYCKLRE